MFGNTQYPSQRPFSVKRTTLNEIFPNISIDTLRLLSGGRAVRAEHEEIILNPQLLAKIASELGAGRNVLSILGGKKVTYSLQELTRTGVIKLLQDKDIRVVRKKEAESDEQ